MIPENRTIVERRWPWLLEWAEGAEAGDLLLIERVPAPALQLNGVQLAGAYAPVEEARLQSSLIPSDAREATVYGLGQGALARELLRRSALRSLRVVLLSRSAVAAALEYVELFDWLDDPRVELVRADRGTSLEVPFTVSPAALRLADPDAWPLRDRIERELAMPFVRRHLHEQREQRSETVLAAEKLAAVDRDVRELAGLFPGKTIRVCASGPTLAEGYAELRASGDPILAVDTALGPLLRAGVVPDFVVSIDGNERSIRRALAPGCRDADDHAPIPLVYFPSVGHDLLQEWRGERYAARPAKGPGADPEPARQPGALFCAGSVLHVAVDLAVKMGARSVVLHGADFATPAGRSHVAGMAWERDVSGAVTGATPHVMDGHGRPVPSLPNLVGYLRDLEDYIAAHPGVRFVNTSRNGARIEGTELREQSHAA